METIIVRTCYNPIVAHITSDKLANAGVENFLFDENTSRLSPTWGFLVGGIKIVVSKENEQRALLALAEIDEEYRKSFVCPKCNANDMTIVPRQSFENILKGVITGIFPGYEVSGENIYQCKACGYETDNPNHSSEAGDPEEY